MIVLTWAARVWGALFIASWAAIGALFAWDWLRGTWRESGRAVNRANARAAASLCKPCNGGSGRCMCSSKCGHRTCGAADTGVMDIDDEYRLLLRRETGR